jgi:hypothetical protein
MIIRKKNYTSFYTFSHSLISIIVIRMLESWKWQRPVKTNFFVINLIWKHLLSTKWKVSKLWQTIVGENKIIFASQGLRFGSPFPPPLADLEYILRFRALIFHWLRLPVHVSNQKTFYTEHMLSTKCSLPTLFLPLFHWMSVILGQFCSYCFSTFCHLNVLIKYTLLVWNFALRKAYK